MVRGSHTSLAAVLFCGSLFHRDALVGQWLRTVSQVLL